MEKKIQRAMAVRGAKSSLRGIREHTRDGLCVGPKYPGKPVEYRYVVSESCAHIERTRQARLERKKNAGKLKQKLGDDEATNKQELKHVNRILRSQYNNVEPSGEYSLHVNDPVMYTFGRMISPLLRSQYPDPEQRWEAIMSFYKRKVKGSRQLPRYRIFTMVKVHLETMLVS